MANLRAFSSCVALAVAALATNAFAVTIDWALIGNPGNAANIVSGTNFGGSVADLFRMAKTETTNADYVEFLNKVDEGGLNVRGLYSSASAADPLYGVSFNGAAPTGSKYSVKAGAPSGAPAGTTYATMPVNFVTWFSAARYVNWLANGQQSGAAGTASIDNGSYTLGSLTSGSIVPRNPGAQVYLPSSNEWYKAAFYNGSAYTAFQTNNNSSPVASSVPAATGNNTGNFASVLNTTQAMPVQVGAYVNTKSAYGLYDMLGNVIEMTDTANGSGQAQVFGGSYGATSAAWNATAAARFVSSTNSTAAHGFRVAAVPEPETITLAAFGLVGLCGANWLKRRRKTSASADADAVAIAA